MYGYEILLESPRRDAQVRLRVVSPRHHASAEAVLQERNLWSRYANWTQVSFRSAHAPTPAARPVEVEHRIPPPGSFVSLYV